MKLLIYTSSINRTWECMYSLACLKYKIDNFSDIHALSHFSVLRSPSLNSFKLTFFHFKRMKQNLRLSRTEGKLIVDPNIVHKMH